MLRKVIILIMLILPITCMATAGFAERYNENMYFAEKMAPFVGIVFVVLADTVIYFLRHRSIFWKFLLAYSLIFTLVGGDWFFQLLFLFIGSYCFYIGGIIILILWIYHFFQRKSKIYKEIFKYWLSLICFILFLAAYDYGCDYLKQTYPIINEKYKWVDPQYDMQ